MGRGQSNQRIELPCKFGTLVAEVVRDDEDYREIAVDLMRSDGKGYQVAVIGTDEHPEGPPNVHVHLWDGEHEETETVWRMNPDGNGFFCE